MRPPPSPPEIAPPLHRAAGLGPLATALGTAGGILLADHTGIAGGWVTLTAVLGAALIVRWTTTAAASRAPRRRRYLLTALPFVAFVALGHARAAAFFGQATIPSVGETLSPVLVRFEGRASSGLLPDAARSTGGMDRAPAGSLTLTGVTIEFGPTDPESTASESTETESTDSEPTDSRSSEPRSASSTPAGQISEIRTIRNDAPTDVSPDAPARVTIARSRLWIDAPDRSIPPGAVVTGLARVTPAAPRRNPGGRDAVQDQRRRGEAIALSVRSGTSLAVEAPGAHDPRVWLHACRARILAALRAELPASSAGLSAALILGYRRDMDPDLLDAASRTGLVHLLAISGLHLAVVIGLVRALLGAILPPRLADVIALLFAGAYAGIAGAGTPILRAAIGCAVVLIGRLVGRRPPRRAALYFAATWILLHDPGDLFRAGFQLSFFAVFGLTARSNPPPVRTGRTAVLVTALVDAVTASLRAFLFTAPLLMHHFGMIAPLSPLLTVLITPCFLIALIAAVVHGLVIAPLGLCIPGLASFVHGALEAFSGAIVLADQLPGISRAPPRPGVAATACFMLAAILVASLHGRARWTRAVVAAVVSALLGGALYAAHYRSPARPELWLLDVGHGQAAVLRDPSGHHLLIDAGSRGRPDAGRRVVVPSLDAIGVASIYAAFASHGDADHIDAITDLLRAGRIRRLFVGPGFEDTRSTRRLLSAARDRRIPVQTARRGDRLRLGPNLSVSVLGPNPRAAALSENDRSLVLSIRSLGRDILLPGDIEQPGILQLLLDEPELSTDILVLPHHGNRDRYTGPLIHRARPELVLASRGEPFPDDTWARSCTRIGATLASTAEIGAILVRIRSLAEGGTLRATGILQPIPITDDKSR